MACPYFILQEFIHWEYPETFLTLPINKGGTFIINCYERTGNICHHHCCTSSFWS